MPLEASRSALIPPTFTEASFSLETSFLKPLIVIFILWPSMAISPFRFPILVIWNTGQGSWATHLTASECLHFDIGGERWPRSNPAKHCFKKRNLILFSHLDWDHRSFLLHLQNQVLRLCHLLSIGWFKKSCQTPPLESKLQIFLPLKDAPKTNAGSRIFVLNQRVVFAGDSPIKMERKWAPKIPRSVKILIVGHHGSRTSTGKKLLHQLDQLQIAIASSRKGRYGHPHPFVKRKLKEQNISLVTTEKWGNIAIRLPLTSHVENQTHIEKF